jgi:hypothetical protein
MEFSILIDSTFVELWAESDLQPVSRKRLLTLVNDFEGGSWRFEKFQNFVWDNISETALSHRERNALQQRPASLLTRAARNLRLTDSMEDFGKGSELAEVVLYGIMKHIYDALPVVPKIFYKQNVQDNAKGADSVHIVLEPGGDFTLWFGEAKFYSSIEDARLLGIVRTIKESITTEKLKKENSIVTSVSDLDDLDLDADLRSSIKQALSHGASIDDLKSKIHVPILLLHECDLTSIASEISPEYTQALITYHKERALAYFTKQIELLGSIHKYALLTFHLILFPVPKKQPIVDKFVSQVKLYRE